MRQLDQNMLSDFITEFHENIENAVNYILMLEENPDDTESLHALFRNFHTIKGNASLVGFEKIARLSHETETLLDNIREQTVEINSEIIETLLMSTDALTALTDKLKAKCGFSSYPAPEGFPKKAEGDQLASDVPLAFYSQIVADAISYI